MNPRDDAPVHSPAGLEMIQAFAEVLEAVRAGEPLEKHCVVRTVEPDFAPRDYTPEDVSHVRRAVLDVDQALFARLLGVSAKTVRAWEQGLRPVSSMGRRFMDEIAASPEHWRARIEQAYKTKTTQPT